MSICVYGRIKRKCINNNLLEKTLVTLFTPKRNVKKNNNMYETYDSVSNEKVMTVSFISEKKAPYNVYDSNIINAEFEYMQLIIFDIAKEKASVDIYKEIINFCVCLNRKTNSDILVTSDAHDDICLLTERKINWSKNLSFNYSQIVQ